ncbi:MAG: hypothetical protein QOH32_1279 [Bradyrhizobium sp.]|nr:hypothetical protein [Bradyrhizobium sp.]
MTTRTRQFAGLASAIVLGLLAMQPTSLRAADECLPGPRGAAPKGSHWYYRVDRAAKKNCWYVRAEGQQSPSANSSAPLPLPQAEAPLQPSVANARAEVDPVNPGQPNGVAAAAAAESVPDSNAPAADNGQSTVASRWLEQTADTNTSTPASAASDAMLNSAPPAGTPQPAATDMRSASPSVVPPLLLVIVGALVAAGGVAGVIFRFGSARRNAPQDFERGQPAPWDVMDIGATIRSPPLVTEATSAASEPAPECHEAVIPDEIVRLLSTLSKEAPA